MGRADGAAARATRTQAGEAAWVRPCRLGPMPAPLPLPRPAAAATPAAAA
jgi:hypothetical protein